MQDVDNSKRNANVVNVSDGYVDQATKNKQHTLKPGVVVAKPWDYIIR